MARILLSSGAQAWYHRDHAAQTATGPEKAQRAAIQKLAGEHERNRIDTVAETLTLVGFLRQKKVLSGPEKIQVTGANYQWVSGSRTQGIQAAHCIPGWLAFNSSALHEMRDWTPENLLSRGLKAQPVSVKLRNLGGRVDLMPTVINTADSALERMSSDRGLKPALRQATYLLMRKLDQRRTDDLSVVEDVVREVMYQYRHTASYVCEERLDDYASAGARAASEQELEGIAQRALAVESYLETVQDRSIEPFTTTPTSFENVLKDVVTRP